MLVEEIPKSTNAKSSTIYFTSTINLSARSMNRNGHGDDEESSTNKKGRAKVNYNVNQLMNIQTQINGASTGSDGPLKSAQQIQLERVVSKRIVDLSKESNNFELPKNFCYNPTHEIDQNKRLRLGNTPSTKKILSARRNLNSYFEEERNLMSINTILGLNYQFVDFSEVEAPRKKKRKVEGRMYRPRVRLCCICGSTSNYSRCHLCGLFYCSVRCNKFHQESRCK
ncbi:uncharacterized protein RJT21DRAFT_28296 [Scheffersomyces amazonensis]|uniref:uncharacterized protein n=1 Tax=Scheffersomyces amazonensis TaxID=1078765 RepID=UPI00315CDDEB